METDLALPDHPPDGCSLAVPEPPTLPAVVRVDPAGLYTAFLDDTRKPATRRARAQDLRDLARYLGVQGPEVACLAFVGGGRGTANAILVGYSAALLARPVSPATFNRRMSTLKQLVELAQRCELPGVDWTIRPKGLHVETYRDTQGPGQAGWKLMHERAKRDAQRSNQGVRDLAIIRLAYYHGFRRESIVTLDLEHWHPDSAQLWVLLKRRFDRIAKTMVAPAVEALERWIRVRGEQPGPLFTALGRRGVPTLDRLSGNAVYDLVEQLGRRAGCRMRVRPHGLRHQGATQVARLSNGNLLMVQAFLDHSDPKTSQKYIDNLGDESAVAAKLLADND